MSGPASAVDVALTAVSGVQFGDYVDALAWRPDGGMLAVGCADGTVHEMLPDGDGAAQVGEHEGGVLAVAYAPDGTLATAGADGRVAIAPLPGRVAGAGWVEHLAWAPDGALLATAVGHRVQLWTPEGRMAAETPALAGTVECIAWSPRGDRVAVGGHGGVTLLGRDAEPAGERLEFPGVVLALAWAPGGRRLACGLQDHAVWVWDVEQRRAATMTGFARKVRELSWSAGGDWLATGGGSVPSAWRFAGDAVEADGQVALRAHERAVGWCGFQPSGSYLATAADDGLLILWEPPGDRPLTAATVGEAAGACAWSPDGLRVALGGAGGRVAVFTLTRAG